jgi:oxygen-independent coproporphyrinogen III oxidase
MAFGLYVHIPFCPQRCPYCAFTILTGHTAFYTRYVEAVCKELRQWQSLAHKGPLQTVFFGGGTPSLLPPEQLDRILHTAASIFGLAPQAEITLEANPTTADTQKFAALRASGFNRLSLGIQSFNDADLQALGRWHTVAEAEAAYATARQAGFDNVNIDVIFSIPGTSRACWQHTVQRLLCLHPEHISTYGLTIEEGTRFARRHQQGRLQPVTEEDDAWAYAWGMETLAAAGYEHYEVSNFARPGRRSQHNWGYWDEVEYLGVGMSAHSFLDGRRHWNVRTLRSYMAALAAGRSPCEGDEVLSPALARQERVWLRLRTCEGIALATAELHTLLAQPKFRAMQEAGLIQLGASHIRLTPAGFLVADAIGTEVIAMLETATNS